MLLNDYWVIKDHKGVVSQSGSTKHHRVTNFHDVGWCLETLSIYLVSLF